MGKLDRTIYCSVVVGVDAHYFDKLILTYPTWLVCHPELQHLPTLVVYDRQQVREDDPRWQRLEDMRAAIYQRGWDRRPETQKYELDPIRRIPWAMTTPGITQRELMLTGILRAVEHVRTPWYLKLDADTFATARTGFYYDSWFRPDVAFVASPWGYTKPAGTIARMNAWAAGIPELAGLPDVAANSVVLANGKSKDVHPRMASWVQFGNTEWCRQASRLCTTERLPFPSQDTYLSYVQARTRAKWLAVKFRHYGWEHCKNPAGLARACADVLRQQVVQL